MMTIREYEIMCALRGKDAADSEIKKQQRIELTVVIFIILFVGGGMGLLLTRALVGG